MSRPRLTAQDRAMRRDRVFARLLDGQATATVAAEEGITPRRVRQMVREALDRWDGNPVRDYADLQIARLETALRALEQRIADGDVSVIDKFVRVLGLMEKYHRDQLQMTESLEDEGDREIAFMDWQARLAASRAAIAARLASKVAGDAPVASAETAAPIPPATAAEAAASAATGEPPALPPPNLSPTEVEVRDRDLAARSQNSPLPVETPRPAHIPAIFVTHFSRT